MGRVLSIVVSVGYIVAAYFAGGCIAAGKFVIFCVLPLACIWFPDAMGSYTGNITAWMGRPAITSTSPGCMVSLVGWLLLLLPLWGGGIVWLASR